MGEKFKANKRNNKDQVRYKVKNENQDSFIQNNKSDKLLARLTK